MKRILVPTDFSDNALKAAFYAAEIARKNGAAIYFVHVLEPVDLKVHQPFRLHEKFTQLVNEKRLNELRKFVKPLAECYKEIKTKIKLIKGEPVHAICRFCIDKKIDLLVMGTKGASGVKEVFLGSITANCMALSPIPVLAIPDEYTLEEPDAVLFVTNHFEKDTELLNKMVDIARLFAATIHVVVFVDKDLIQDYAHNHRAEELNNYLEFLRHKFPFVSFKGELLEGTSFEGAVERYEIENHVDIIAMIPYHKDFLDRILRKSATRRMAFHSRIPVLAVQIDPARALQQHHIMIPH